MARQIIGAGTWGSIYAKINAMFEELYGPSPFPIRTGLHYVSTSGSNSNDGLSVDTPWQTLAYAESQATAPGDVIALKKGDVFSSSTAVTITHGGEAGNPIIWDGSLWGTGANAIIRSSAHRIAPNLAVVGIMGCQHVTFQSITVDGNNTRCFGLTIGGPSNFYCPGVQNAEANITVQDCSLINFGDGTAYQLGFLCETWNNDITGITVRRCILDGCDDEQLSFYCGKVADGATPAQCSNVYIGYNTLTNWGRRGTSTGYGLQINNKVTNAVIERNVLTTGASGHGNAMHIEGNEVAAGFFPTGIIVRYNKFTVTETNKFCLFITQGQAKTVDVYCNIFIQGNNATDTDGGCVWVVASAVAWTGAVLRFFNNTLYSQSGRTFQNDCAESNIVTIKNNIMYNAGTDDYGCMCLIINTSASTIHNNNSFYRSANVNYTKVKDAGSYKQTNAQVIAWEATSQPANPNLVAPATDQHILTTSPCKYAGVAISGITKDYAGMNYYTPPSIGAYEFV